LRTFTENEAPPPPGTGFVMMPESTPGESIAAAGRLNVIVLPEMVPATPASDADVEAMKPVPEIVTACAPDPAATVAGETPETAGFGLRMPLIVNAAVLLVPPPGAGLKTLTAIAPGVDTALTGTATVNDVADEDTGESWTAPNVTTEVPVKLFPRMVSVKPAPTGVLVGEIVDSSGTPFVVLSVVFGPGELALGPLPPPGLGF
jgi:hypothetical protein